MKGHIYGVSLGPGDPELITVKGLKALQSVDKIYYPGSLWKDGRQTSYSLAVLESYDLDPKKLEGFYLEMSLERAHAKEAYEAAYQKIKADYLAGRSVAIVSEGDLSTFSSFSYLLEKIHQDNLSTSLIPGISSFALLAAQAQQPICLQDEKVLVYPRVQSSTDLKEAIEHHDTIILMKIRSVIEVIDQVIKDTPLRVHYAEYLGTEKQFISEDWALIKARKTPYFSLMMIKK